MKNRFLISVTAILVLSQLLDFVVHGLLLAGDYAPLAQAGVFRLPEDSQRYMAFMIVAHLLIAVGFTWVYRQGVDRSKPVLGQGLRFGIAVALLATIPGYLIYYAVTPLPPALVIKQIAFSTVAVLILGIATAAINQRA